MNTFNYSEATRKLKEFSTWYEDNTISGARIKRARAEKAIAIAQIAITTQAALAQMYAILSQSINPMPHKPGGTRIK